VAILGLVTLLLLAAAPVAAQPAGETVWIPMTERALGVSRTLRLEATLYRPAKAEGAPVLIFNHGSTGAFRVAPTVTQRYPEVAQFFVERGFTVLIPMRRGRGASEGEYLERYECQTAMLDAGVERAIEDLDAVMAFAAAQPWFDPRRFLLGGMSRGGLLSVAYAARRGTAARGVLNFAGGWIAEFCERRIHFNAQAFGQRSVPSVLPNLWLYAENDRNYGPAAIRAAHAAFVRAGGTAALTIFPPIDPDGHIFLPRTPSVWSATVDAWLTSLGF
jgi:dienelactone hydrolase